jgi:hypothetical protein
MLEHELARLVDPRRLSDLGVILTPPQRDTLRWWRRTAHSARAVDDELVTDLSVRDLELDEQ